MKTMVERITEIRTMIEQFNEDFDQFRENTNPNEPHCVITAQIKGFNGNGFPTDTPEEDMIDETI